MQINLAKNFAIILTPIGAGWRARVYVRMRARELTRNNIVIAS